MVRDVDLWKRASKLRKHKKWTQAISNYSQAIEMAIAIERSSKQQFLWVGRAMCYHGLGDWYQVKIDCTKALELKPDDPKAHFYYGVALVHTNDADEGMKHMEKALDLANCQPLRAKANFVEEVNKELVKAKYLKCQKSCAAETLLELQTLKEACVCALKEKHERANSETECDLSRQLSRLDEVFDKAFRTVTPNDNAPSHLLCHITREIMRDPVITPSGFTYDRSILVSFLREGGTTDPLTGAPLNERQLVPNRAIKEAVAAFLKDNMWAEYY